MERVLRNREQALIDVDTPKYGKKALLIFGVFIYLIGAGLVIFSLYMMNLSFSRNGPDDYETGIVMLIASVFLLFLFGFAGTYIVGRGYWQVNLLVFDDGICTGWVLPMGIIKTGETVIPWMDIKKVDGGIKRYKRSEIPAIFIETHNGKVREAFVFPGMKTAIGLMKKRIPDKITPEATQIVKELDF